MFRAIYQDIINKKKLKAKKATNLQDIPYLSSSNSSSYCDSLLESCNPDLEKYEQNTSFLPRRLPTYTEIQFESLRELVKAKYEIYAKKLTEKKEGRLSDEFKVENYFKNGFKLLSQSTQTKEKESKKRVTAKF